MTGFALLYQIDINSYRDRNKKIKQIDKKIKTLLVIGCYQAWSLEQQWKPQFLVQL